MRNFKKILLTVWILIWSLPLNIFALVLGLGLLILGVRPRKWGPALHFVKGHDWGGLEMGLCFFMTDDEPDYQTKCHEMGHLLQQAIFGPFMPFVVSFPSASRYWLFVFKTQKARYLYGAILTAILIIIALGIFFAGLLVDALWLTIIGFLLIAYVGMLCSWLIMDEIPKFSSAETRPKYNELWCEADASRRGEAFMKKYYPNLE